ncbi:MAG: hypothetical protein CMM08_14680 [Rhodospirillaceae bacterium]|nr:hypothetical protein [Rhodospirillaceae bacterium]
MNADKKFLSGVVAVVIALALVSAAVNMIVDPYGVHSLVEVEGFNTLKPSAQGNLRLAKAYNISSQRPDGVFLGNSRVEQGFDPARASARFHRSVYNAGLPGSTIYENYRYLQHAAQTGTLKDAVLGLDIFAFNTNMFRRASNFSEGRLAVQLDGQETPIWDVARFRDLHQIYVAWPTLMKSIATVMDQDQPWVSTRTMLGFNPVIEGVEYARVKSYWRSFRKQNRKHIRLLKAHPMNFGPTAGWPNGSMVYFERLVAFCRANKINLVLAIHPYHAHMLEVIQGSGAWPVFESWKRELVAVLASDRARHPGAVEFVLWDFSGYNSITTEKVPPQGSAQETKWYWESSHYKPSVSPLMALRAFGHGDMTAGQADFGVMLWPGNLEAHMRSFAAKRQAYRQARPEEMADIQRLFEAEK